MRKTKCVDMRQHSLYWINLREKIVCTVKFYIIIESIKNHGYFDQLITRKDIPMHIVGYERILYYKV